MTFPVSQFPSHTPSNNNNCNDPTQRAQAEIGRVPERLCHLLSLSFVVVVAVVPLVVATFVAVVVVAWPSLMQNINLYFELNDNVARAY